MDIILKPFAMLLMFLFETFNSYGLALILFGVIIKVVLFPVTLKSKKSMIQMNMLSGKQQALQRQYGKDRERYNIELQKLYEKEKVNPMGGCLWSLIPMFVLIGLYGIIREPMTSMMNLPKDMIDTVAQVTGIANEGTFPQLAMVSTFNDPAMLAAVKAAVGEAGADLRAINFSFLGMDLSAIPSWSFWKGGLAGILMFVMVILSAAVSFISMKVSMATNQMSKNAPANPQMDQTNKMMTWMMPAMSLWIGFTVPAGLTVYWITQYIVNMASEVICGKMLQKDYEAARIAAEEAAAQAKIEEKQRKEEARLDRARRIEEEKLAKKKHKAAPKTESTEPGINKDDSREGLRAYARGRAYMPDRFGGVTQYTDPNELMRAEQAAKEEKSSKKSKKDKEEK